MKNSINLVLALIATVGTFDAHAKDQHIPKLTSLSGTYKSVQSEDWGRGTYGLREFSFDQGKWTLKFKLALDKEMKIPVFEFRTYGVYKVLTESKTVPGAYDALFLEDKKFLTLRTEDANLVKSFGLADCELSKDKEKDISKSGCANWKPVSVCHEDHDLLMLNEQGQLFFGQRPEDNDMCTANKRPKKLNYPVEKI